MGKGGAARESVSSAAPPPAPAGFLFWARFPPPVALFAELQALWRRGPIQLGQGMNDVLGQMCACVLLFFIFINS